MVIGDDQRQAELASSFRFGDARDAAIDGDDHVAALRGDRPQCVVVEAVAFVDAIGDVVIRLRAEQLEAEQQNRRGGHAVGVVIAVDGDSPAGANRLVQQLGGLHGTGSSSGSRRPLSLTSRNCRAPSTSQMPRPIRSWATTAGMPAALPQRGHPRRIITRNAPAFGHRAKAEVRNAEGGGLEHRLPSHSPLPPSAFLLLLLFGVHRVLAQAGAVLLQLQLLAAGLATERVVVIARLLADEEHGFDFLLSFSSSHGRVEGSEFRVQKERAGASPAAAKQQTRRKTGGTLHISNPRLYGEIAIRSRGL